MKTVTDEELIFLDNLVYLNVFDQAYKDTVIDFSVREIVEHVKLNWNADGTKDFYFIGTEDNQLAAISPDDWISLLENFSSKYEDYSDFWDGYILEDCVAESNEDGAFLTCTFVKRDEENNVEDIVVIFRGTASDAR